MSSISTSYNPVAPKANLSSQLAHLCVLQAAANWACKVRSDVKYASRDSVWDQSLNDFQKFLCKLAQVCHSEKGGKTMTALACLLDVNGGGNFVFTSNLRKEPELESTKKFLEELLGYVASNPQKLEPKAFQRQILWRCLRFGFAKVDGYLTTLTIMLEKCIEDYRLHEASAADSAIVEQLKRLQNLAHFPRDPSSDAGEQARDKLFSDCETLIKAVQATKNTPIDKVIHSYASQGDSESSYIWCELRHVLGRLHSFRQAAEAIEGAPIKWPTLFNSFKVSYLPPGKTRRTPSPTSPDLANILSVAFPESDLAEFEEDIVELQSFGLERNIFDEIRKKKYLLAFVHGEVQLHDYLARQGKTHSSHYWDGSLFIATSKPTCRLCHYYFQCSDNNFHIQSPHMNLYPKWCLPEACGEEVMEEVIEQMQADTLQMLREKLPEYRRHDSRTDSHVTLETPASRGSAGSRVSDMRSFGIASRSQQARVRIPSRQMHLYPPSAEVPDDEWTEAADEFDHRVIVGEIGAAK